MSRENVCGFCFEEFPSSVGLSEHRATCTHDSRTQEEIGRRDQASSDRDSSLRIQKFRSLEKHPVHSRAFKSLGAGDRRLCEEFILLHDHLSKFPFTAKVNRWMLDDPRKPTKHATMWGLVILCAEVL